MNGLDKFMSLYAVKLRECKAKYPEEYPWPDSQFNRVLERMHAAFENGTYEVARAVKATCKGLGIRPTRRDIDNYIREGK